MENLLGSIEKCYRCNDIVYYITGWRKVLMIMIGAPGNEGVSDFVSNERGQINKTNLQSYFEIELQYVLMQAQYMCPIKYSTCSVTTWCKNLNHNAIMKKGSENDKALVEASKTRYCADV